MYKEDIDISNAIKQEISRVIDQWTNDLIQTKIVTPQMNPSDQRGLWDRIKGSLSNIWYGGRYNQENPYYWKNRFGDDLGSKQESYDPRVFSLNEYKEIKKAIKETENTISENLTSDVEKLKIVRIIRSSAEELKKKLYDIFVNNCSGDGGQKEKEEEQGGEVSDGDSVVNNDGESSRDWRPERDTQSSADSGDAGQEITRLPPVGFDDSQAEPDTLRLDPKVYLKMKPKRSKNKGKTAEQLRRRDQWVDFILHEDFKDYFAQLNLAKIAPHIIKRLDDIEHDAKLNKEREQIIEDIIKAKEKFISMLPKDEE